MIEGIKMNEEGINEKLSDIKKKVQCLEIILDCRKKEPISISATNEMIGNVKRRMVADLDNITDYVTRGM